MDKLYKVLYKELYNKELLMGVPKVVFQPVKITSAEFVPELVFQPVKITSADSARQCYKKLCKEPYQRKFRRNFRVTATN